jgi:hypothetical protein
MVRERERDMWNCVGGIEKMAEKKLYSVLKVHRQCSLVLLVEVKHMIGINSKCKYYAVRGAALKRNLIRR